MPRKQRIHYTDELKSEIWNKYIQGKYRLLQQSDRDRPLTNSSAIRTSVTPGSSARLNASRLNSALYLFLRAM